MFKVKATLVSFMGDEEKYPCHFGHQIGDEIIFDGEKYIGKLCPGVWPILTPKVNALYQAGPRFVEPFFYCSFWYAPPSVKDPAQKKYDGLGFANVLKTHIEPRFHMATLSPPNAFKWPPHPERTVAKEISVTCPDLRTAAVFVLEAFDLSDRGYDVPYFRRQMVILHKVLKKQGIPEVDIVNEFSREDREEIYPPMVPELLLPLNEELELMGYIERKNGAVFVTKRGEAKLEEFKKNLTAEDTEGLKL